MYTLQLCQDIKENRVLTDRETATRLTALMLQGVYVHEGGREENGQNGKIVVLGCSCDLNKHGVSSCLSSANVGDYDTEEHTVGYTQAFQDFVLLPKSMQVGRQLRHQEYPSMSFVVNFVICSVFPYSILN